MNPMYAWPPRRTKNMGVLGKKGRRADQKQEDITHWERRICIKKRAWAVSSPTWSRVQSIRSREWWGSGLCSMCSVISDSWRKKGTKCEHKTYRTWKSFFKVEYIVWKSNTIFYNALRELNIQKHVVWSMWVGDGVKRKKNKMFGRQRLFQIWLCEPHNNKSPRKIRNENIWWRFFAISNYKTYIFSPRRRRPKRMVLEGYASLRRWKCKLT